MVTNDSITVYLNAIKIEVWLPWEGATDNDSMADTLYSNPGQMAVSLKVNVLLNQT